MTITKKDAYEMSLVELASCYDEIRAEAGRYWNQCEATQETLRQIRQQARQTIAAAKRDGFQVAVPSVFAIETL